MQCAIPGTTKKSTTTDARTGHFNTTGQTNGDSRIEAIFDVLSKKN